MWTKVHILPFSYNPDIGKISMKNIMTHKFCSSIRSISDNNCAQLYNSGGTIRAQSGQDQCPILKWIKVLTIFDNVTICQFYDNFSNSFLYLNLIYNFFFAGFHLKSITVSRARYLTQSFILTNMYNVDANNTHRAYLLVRAYLYRDIWEHFLSTMFSLTKRHKIQI